MQVVASNYEKSEKNRKRKLIWNLLIITNNRTPLHDYSNKAIKLYLFLIENPGHARFSLLHCTHPISGIWRSVWGSFSKCNSLL